MKFYDPDENFPRFKNYLVSDFGQLASNAAIIDGMKKWGNMTGAEARSYLIPGSGPLIRIVGDNDPLVLKPTADFPDILYLGFFLVNHFESTAGKAESAFLRTGNGKKLYRVGLSILEDLISGHLYYFSLYRDPQDNTKVNLRILAFEQEVYGGIMPE